MADGDREKWNKKYETATVAATGPDSWLVECINRIRFESPNDRLERALDLACGLGHNSIWLARNGLRMDAIDISQRGLEIASQNADAQGAEVRWVAADVDHWVPEHESYDIAMVFRFLDRVATPHIIRDALRPGGWLIYETFSRAQLDRADNHLRNPDFTLAPGELSDTMFTGLDVVVDREAVLPDRTVQQFLARRG